MKYIAENTAQAMILMGTSYRVEANMLPFESHTEEGVNVHAVLVGGLLLISEALHKKIELSKPHVHDHHYGTCGCGHVDPDSY